MTTIEYCDKLTLSIKMRYGIEASRAPPNQIFPSHSEALAHALWLIDQSKGDWDDPNRADARLRFVEGILWAVGCFSADTIAKLRSGTI